MSTFDAQDDDTPWPPPDETFGILAQYLDNDYTVFPMAEGAAEEEDVQSLAARCGVTFPDEFLAHVSGRFPGIYIEVNEDVWPRPKAMDVGPFWSFLYGLHTYTPCPGSQDWMRLDYAARQFQQTTGHQAAPILKVIGDANVYCITSDGTLAYYDHETNELEPVELGFWELFEREVEELSKRKDRKVEGT